MSTSLFAPTAVKQVKKAVEPRLPQPTSLLTTPSGPPVPVLMQHNFFGGVADFAARVQHITDAHEQTYGYRPKPQQVLDLALAPNWEQQTRNLFTPNPAATAAMKAFPPSSDAAFVKQMQQAAKGPGWDDWLQQNGDRVQALAADKTWQAKVHGIVLTRNTFDAAVTRAKASGLTDEQANLAALHSAKVNAMGLADVGFIARPISQIVSSLVHSPGGMAQVAGMVVPELLANTGEGFIFNKALSQIGVDRRLPKTDFTFPQTRRVGEAMGKSLAEDVRHPIRNFGFLTLDILGFASVGFGAGARVASASRVARAGEGAGATVRALGKKPPLQRVELRLGDYTEQMPLSSNPLVASFQKRVLGARQVAADKRLVDAPSPLRQILMPEGGVLSKTVSFERKVGRESDVRQRIEHIARMQLARDLEHIAGYEPTAKLFYDRIPAKYRNKLTVGEQKAIFAQSWDIVGTPLEKVQAEAAMHQRMIDAYGEAEGPQFVKNHQRHLVELKLAEKVLENPSPRFTEALGLTQQVVAKNQWLRIEKLGLSPLTAEGRIAKSGQVLRGEEVTQGGKPVSGDSFYLTSQPRGKQKRRPSEIRGFFSSNKPGPYGQPPGRDTPPELTHEMTGSAIISGKNRSDATNLATEAYGRTARAIAIREEHAKKWDAAQPTWGNIPEPFRQAIRDSNKISDEHRALVAAIDDGLAAEKFTNAELDLLPSDYRVMIEDLYPNWERLSAEELQGVKWLDGRLLGENSTIPFIPSVGTEIVQAVNAPVRFARLFLRPAYALNKLGNEAMLVFDQGVFNSIENLAHASALEEIEGVSNASAIRAHVGQGKSASYVSSASGRMSRSVAQWWTRWTDRDERVASWLYYAKRKGYDTPEKRNALLNDDAHRAELVEVDRRANKALVQFDNLSPIERNYFRNIIFVYPWVRGSAVWSLRAIMEHPAKTAILSHLGRRAIQNDPILDRATEWYKRIGYFPLGFDHKGNPMRVNPTSVNTFSTWQEFLSIGKGATVGDKYATIGDLGGPFVEFGLHALSGRDEFGNKYPAGQFWGAVSEVLAGLPQLAQIGKKPDKPLKAFDITDRASLEARINSALDQTVFTPGWLGGYGSLLIGGFSPKGVNKLAMIARYWRDASDEDRHAWSLDLLHRAAERQAKLLDRPLPTKVSAAITRQAELSYQYDKHITDTGREPTPRERADFTFDYLKDRIPAADRTKELADLRDLTDKNEINQWWHDLFTKYGGGDAIKKWDKAVGTVASFNLESFNHKAKQLHQLGLAPQRVYNTPQDQLYEYGRKYLAFTEKVQALGKEIKDGKAVAADMRLLQDENSKPQKGLPSFAAIAWVHNKPEDNLHAMLTLPTKGWATLTAVEKQIVGKPVDPAVTEAWTAYAKLTTPEELAKQLPPGQRSLDKTQRLSVVKQIDRYYKLGGKFLSDYEFSQRPIYQRLGYMNIVKDSPHRNDWQALFKQADTLTRAVTDKRTTMPLARDAWKDYARQLVGYYRTENPAFWKELAPILDANPSFLEGLINRG